jgi:hypothetical protein
LKPRHARGCTLDRDTAISNDSDETAVEFAASRRRQSRHGTSGSGTSNSDPARSIQHMTVPTKSRMIDQSLAD